MDQVPDRPKLYIGGLDAVDQLDMLDSSGITHIVSLLEYDHLDWPEYAKYYRLWLQIEDNAEDIMQYFSTIIEFIDNGLASGGAVLVHCAMGQSRSAAAVCAYIMAKGRLSVREAMAKLRHARPMCEPNEGFMEQLRVYESFRPEPRSSAITFDDLKP